MQPRLSSFLSTGDKDVSRGGDPVRSALDALSNISFDQLFCVHTLFGCLVPIILSDVHLFQQRNQPRDIQCHVSEVPLSISRAVPLQAPRGKAEEIVSHPRRLRYGPRPSIVIVQYGWTK